MDVGIWAFESLLKKENEQTTRIQRLAIMSVKRGEFSINWKIYTFKSETAVEYIRLKLNIQRTVSERLPSLAVSTNDIPR